MRLGLFGGTFDPPHTGHLLVALDAVDALELDRLVFIPAAIQPLKTGRTLTPAVQRLAMVRALISEHPRLEADAIEVDREGLSYSVDTVAEFARRHPDAERFFLVGADVVPTLPQWRMPDRIAELASIVVLRRGDEAMAGGPGEMEAMSGLGQGGANRGEGPMVLATRRIDISSTEIRERVRQGKSIRGFVPDPVADYIAAQQLYR